MSTSKPSFIPRSNESRVYVFPRVQEVPPSIDQVKKEPIRMLILPDGNNRASLDGITYSDGGRKFKEVAQFLATQGGVSELVMCIMSQDNVEKRSDNFFGKIHRAFLTLNGHIKARDALIRDGIRLSTHGDVENLSQKGEVAAQLADTIDTVVSRTSHIEQPSLEVIFGINYSGDIAKALHVNTIVRTGMEEKGVFRSSGISIPHNCTCFSSTALWPYFETREMGGIVEKMNTGNSVRLKSGYSAMEIQELMQAVQTLLQKDRSPEHKVADTRIVIPYNVEEREEIMRAFSGQSSMIDFVPWGEKRIGRDAYFAFLVPGQTMSEGIIVGESPAIGYSNVFSCGRGPKDIVLGSIRATHFNNVYEILRGAEREVTIQTSPEFSPYYNLINRIKERPDQSLEEIAPTLLSDRTLPPTSEAHYNMMADLFAATMVEWSDNVGLPWPNAKAFRAFLNYILTSFCFAYYPNHPVWKEKFQSQWEKRARFLSKYMVLTYAVDDFVYDATKEGDKKVFLEHATTQLAQSIQINQDPPAPSDDKILNILTAEFRKFAIELSEESSPEAFKNWQTGMTDIILCMQNEWEESVLENDLLDRIATDENAREQFEQKYLSDEIPLPLREKIKDAFKNYLNGDERIRHAAYYDLKLYMYLVDIEKSIGSGNIYKTMACIGSREEPLEPEAMKDLNALCALINYYFRMANDLAEFSRSADDRDDKVSSIQILQEKYAQGTAEDRGATDIFELTYFLRDEMYKAISEFQKKYDNTTLLLTIGIALQRARIGELFYKGTHYREALRKQVQEFFKMLMNCGIV